MDATTSIHAYTVDIAEWDPSPELYDELLAALNDEDAAQKIRNYRLKRDALGNLVGRILAAWNICTRSSRGRGAKTATSDDYPAGYAWSVLRQDKEPKGRPYLATSASGERIPEYDFNVSHDGCMVLMTAAYTKTSSLDMHRVSEGMQMRLGADVMQLALPQGIPTVPEFEETLADLLAPAEKELLARCPESDKLGLLLHLWTAKEAISKATGDGLSFPYARLDCSRLRERGYIDVPDLNGGADRICTCKEWTVDSKEGKYLCVVAALEDAESALEQATFEKLEVGRLVTEVQRLAGPTKPS